MPRMSRWIVSVALFAFVTLPIPLGAEPIDGSFVAQRGLEKPLSMKLWRHFDRGMNAVEDREIL